MRKSLLTNTPSMIMPPSAVRAGGRAVKTRKSKISNCLTWCRLPPAIHKSYSGIWQGLGSFAVVGSEK